MFDEGYVIFAATPKSTGAGLGFSAPEIASSLSLMGPTIFIVQLVGFPLLNSRFTTLTLWRGSAIMISVLYPLFSLLPHLNPNKDKGAENGTQWVFLILLLWGRFAVIIIGYTSISILVGIQR